MSAPAPLPRPAGALSRRTLLAAVGVTPLLLAVGCSREAPAGADAVTPAQVDQLAGQVAVQEELLAAYDVALLSAPELAGLADQARAQLTRLRAAAPSATPTTGAVSPTVPAVAGDAGTARATLRTQVAAAATSHATACPDFTGARAALLGSIAAGLRGQDGQLA